MKRWHGFNPVTGTSVTPVEVNVNSHLLPTVVCVTGPLEGSQATLCSPELLPCGSQETQERHQHQTNTCKKLLITNVTIHLACGHRWLRITVSLRRNEEKDLINQVGYKHSEIILEFQGQEDLNVCFFFFFPPGGSLDSYFWSNWIKDDELFRDKQFHTGMKKKEVRSY